ncbi:MAG TPA: helix-turn-helix transcriptional regulator [Thermoanaerobaculia bacterium]|jgi:transcriptional regulator with XRE-family HTH domain|nr:helix-turn-helix transcriptional regulator [Thermoanaerobaculia bacterium]
MTKANPTARTDVKHVLDTLKSAIRLLGFSVRDIEKKLGYSFGYLSRVFAGTIELKMEHILDIANALDMMPEELLAFVYPNLQDPPSESAVELWRRVGGRAPAGTITSRNEAQAQLMDEMASAFRRSLSRVFGALARDLAAAAEDETDGEPE